MTPTRPPFAEWLQTHTFTATDLENYRLCPYRFYASAYLDLKPGNPLEVEMTPPEMGSLVHRILEKSLRGGADRDVRLQHTCSRILEDELSAFRRDRPHLSKVLLGFQKAKIERMLASFLEDLEVSRSSAWTPRYFEWGFGQGSPALTLKDSEGRPFSLKGRIDRIDVNEAQKTFLVIDYKTGSAKITGNQIKSGEALQLPLYLMAVKELLLPDHEPAGAVYYQLSDMSKKDGLLHADRLPAYLDVGPRSSSLVPASRWEGVLEEIAAKAGAIVSEIRRTPEDGFVSEPEPCEAFCPYQDICRMRSCSL